MKEFTDWGVYRKYDLIMRLDEKYYPEYLKKIFRY